MNEWRAIDRLRCVWPLRRAADVQSAAPMIRRRAIILAVLGALLPVAALALAIVFHGTTHAASSISVEDVKVRQTNDSRAFALDVFLSNAGVARAVVVELALSGDHDGRVIEDLVCLLEGAETTACRVFVNPDRRGSDEFSLKGGTYAYSIRVETGDRHFLAAEFGGLEIDSKSFSRSVREHVSIAAHANWQFFYGDDIDCLRSSDCPPEAKLLAGVSFFPVGKLTKLGKASKLAKGASAATRYMDDLIVLAKSRLPNIARVRSQLETGGERLRELLDSAFKECTSGSRKCFGNLNELVSVDTLSGMSYRITGLYKDQAKDFMTKIDGQWKKAAPDGTAVTPGGLRTWIESRTVGNLGYDFLRKKAKFAKRHGFDCVTLVVHNKQDLSGVLSLTTAENLWEKVAKPEGIGFEIIDMTRGGVTRVVDQCV